MPNEGRNRKNQLHARLDRRQKVAQMYLRGMGQVEIARQLGCSQPTVSNDLASLRSEWLASAIRDFDQAKAQELAKLDQLEREAWAAWERSCKDAKTNHERTEQVPKVTKRRGRLQVGPEEERLVTVRRILETTSKRQVGDARFLQQVAWCIEARLKLLIDVRIDDVEKRLAEVEGKR